MQKRKKAVEILQGCKNSQPTNFAGCEFSQVAKFRNTAPLHLLLTAF